MAKSSVSKKTKQVGKAKLVSEDGGQSKAIAAKLKKLQAENTALRKAAAAKENVGAMIPRPTKGVAGNGFNLQVAMHLENDPMLYSSLRRSVRGITAMSGINPLVKWTHQPKDKIANIIGAARESNNYLSRFPGGWPVEEFIKTHLKNKRAYNRKLGGQLEELTNVDDAGSEMDVDHMLSEMDVDREDDEEGDGKDQDEEDDEEGDGKDKDDEEWGGIGSD